MSLYVAETIQCLRLDAIIVCFMFRRVRFAFFRGIVMSDLVDISNQLID